MTEIVKEHYIVANHAVIETAFKLALKEVVEDTLISEAIRAHIEQVADEIHDALALGQTVVQDHIAYHIEGEDND